MLELKCPNQSILSRNFSVENDVLTYTQTNIAYNIESLTSDTLYLLGQNVSRNLRYLKINAETGRIIFPMEQNSIIHLK